MRIACDNHVGRGTLEALEAAGHEVVYWANDEPDEVWFTNALDLDAEVFVSADWDISFLANRYNRAFIRLKAKRAGHAMTRYLLEKLSIIAA